jgi:prevent-host-death family protein
MERDYSIAQARNRLSEIVHEAEAGKPVRLTRRGKPVAVLIAARDYQRLSGQSISFWDALTKFREAARVETLGIGREVFEGLRSREPGRDVRL